MFQKPVFLNLFLIIKVSLEWLAFLFAKYNLRLFFIVLILFQNVSNAQVKQLDSLKTLLVKLDDGDEKELKLLNAITLVQVNIKPDDALANADNAITLAQKLNNQIGLAVAYNNKGFVLLRKSQYEEANKFLKKALVLNVSLKNQNGIADNQTNLAEILRRQGETANAKVILEKALLIYQQTNNKNGIADVYYYLGLVYRDLSDNKRTLELNNKAIELYLQTGNSTGLALANNAKSGYYYRISDYSQAILYSTMAIEMNERIENLYGLSLDFGNISNVYAEMAEFPKAISYSLKALRIHEKMDNRHMAANTLINIGTFYSDLNQPDKALNYLQRGTLLFDQLNISNGQYRMGMNYLGIVYLHMNNVSKALETLNKSLILSLKTNDDWALGVGYLYLGKTHLKLKRYGLALDDFRNGIIADEKIENPSGCAFDYLGISKAISLASNEDLIKSGINPSEKNHIQFDYIQKSIQIGNEIRNKIIQRDALELLSIYYEEQGNDKKSFEFYKQYIAYKDSITNTDNANAVALLQIQYDTEKKEQQINLLTKDTQLQQAELQKQDTTRKVLIAAFGLAALLAGIIYNRYRIKKKANLEIEKTMQHLKNTQEQLIEREKLASLGKLTSDVARQIEVPVSHINTLNKANRILIHAIRSKKNYKDNGLKELKSNLHQIYNYGKDADGIVKNVLAETRKLQG